MLMMIAPSPVAHCFQPVRLLTFRLYQLMPPSVHLESTQLLPQHKYTAFDHPRCDIIVDRQLIYRNQVQRIFLAWLLMSSNRRRWPLLKFKFNSWYQMVIFQAVLAECFGADEAKGRPCNAKKCKKRRSIFVRRVRQCGSVHDFHPVPIVKKPWPRKGESLTEQRITAMVGFSLRRVQICHAPRAHLDQARRLLLLNQELQPHRRELIKLSISSKDCSLLPDRPRWMQRPFESVWPRNCRIRAGAEPPGYEGPLWAKKEWLKRKKKATEVDSLPRNMLKRKLKKPLERKLRWHKESRKGKD